MARDEQTLLAKAIEQTIDDWGLDQVTSEEISRHILGGTTFWSTALLDGSTLSLVRLYSPVVQRQEVFLGNVLLNDFLFKALPRAVERSGLGEAVLLLNDLESAYILWRGTGDLEVLRDAYRDEVLAALPDLYFGDEDPARGIHGDMSKLFTFTKSDFEPFPVYSVPAFLSFELERMVRRQIRQLLQSEDFERNLRTVMAAFAFFYGQTSGGAGDAQSFATFLYRLVTHYQVLPEDKIKVVFGLDEVSKQAIKSAIDDTRFEPHQIKNSLLELGQWFADEVDGGNVDWLLGFIRKDEKLIQINEKDFLNEILGQVQMGFLTACGLYSQSDTLPVCPLCGSHLPAVRESYVIVGINKSRFTTRSPKRKGNRQDSVICARCALDVYTLARAVGTDDIVWQKQPRKTARMPRLYNVVFHYGRHNDWEVEAIQRQMDYVLAHASGEKGIKELWADLQQLREQVAQEHDAFIDLAEIDWEAWVSPAMEVVAQMQQDVRAEVIPLGEGDYRLLVFILPQLRPGRKEGLDFVQKRFSRSRLAVYTLLGLLRNLCGCDGPYYFQSLPTLVPGRFDPNTFYVSGRAEQADTALRRYGAITDFARRVVKYRKGHSVLADWIMLAEQLERDPLGVFSDVLRASPKTKRDFSRDYRNKFKYRSLGAYDSINDTGLGVVDSAEYLTLYEMLHEMAKGGNTMPKQVPIEQVDAFCDNLFRALDRAGLLPTSLGEAAHAFEKHARLLIGLLGRYEQIEAGLAEWETRALRAMHDSRREVAYPYFHALREWLIAPDNRQLFEGDGRKDNLNHLKRGLYSRIYIWLYPRRKLAAAYAQAHAGNAAQFKPEVITQDFVGTTESICQELGLAVDDLAVADAQAFAIAKRGYYRKWKPGAKLPNEEEEKKEETEL